MPWGVIFFYLIATVSILSAIGVVAARNPVHSSIFLVLCFLNVAGIFVMLGAEFLAVIQVIVYTGAILVLVLFVLMLVNPDELPSFTDAQPLQRYLGLLLGAVLLLEVGAAIITRTALEGVGEATPENVAAVGGNVHAVGRVLFSDYLLAFEVISIVLTVGILGAIVLAAPERLGEKLATRRGTISLSHTRGTDAELPVGPRGETPIKTDPNRRPPRPEAPRRVIKVTDPDERTTIGGTRR
ncbi:MAG TPA: NADH-quinone oxidoreductase subunit J [Thermomicrobiales bacterium]|nr:NADH-quinone oxidoreductase subunit J [Thermomicrobiales bacterium]